MEFYDFVSEEAVDIRYSVAKLRIFAMIKVMEIQHYKEVRKEIR